MIRIKRGLDLPITGDPQQSIEDGPTVRSVAVVGFDYHGMKPTMAVQAGDTVKKGQVLFSDKRNPGVVFTSPAGGTVAAINRGERRVLQSVVIDVDLNNEQSEVFSRYSADTLGSLARDQVAANLQSSGLWAAFRTRPFSKAPAIDQVPNAIFVTAMDTNPLAADPAVVLAGKEEGFNAGLTILSRLTEGKVFVCHATGSQVPTNSGTGQIVYHAFDGPHPAGLAGTHIHFLSPVSENKTVWSINYQDVVAIGHLFLQGELDVERVVSLAGPQVDKPRLLRTRIGASTDEICAGQLKAGSNRVISGSVLSGRTANGPFAYLGRFHQQISVIVEDRERKLLHYMSPGSERHSVLNIYLSKLNPTKKFSFTSTTNGSERAMVPVGAYERIMPLDILPTQLLRSLIVGDMESAISLGCLELDEEDLALCTYVCPGKYEYGPILRDNLNRIEAES